MKGTVQIYGGLLGENGLKDEYENVEGYSSSGEEIRYNQETCDSAAKKNDPTALV
jgi:hypothetical protein